MKARLKKEFFMALVTVPIVTLGFFVVAIALRYLGKAPSFVQNMNDKVLNTGAIISIVLCLPIPVWMKMIFRANDELGYDKFGMSKKNRHFMRRDLREGIEADKIANLEKIVPSEELRRMTKKGSIDPDGDIARLVGLDAIKARIEDMKIKMAFDKRERSKKNNPSFGGYHAVYYGSPGVGKTEVARIASGILYDNYCIKENKTVEVDGAFLRGKGEEETALKVRIVASAAKGGVLFIDEAYELGYGRLGQCAIATLVKEMEDSRGELTVILAGYKDKMRDLLAVNPGFASRIREFWEFPDYSDDELWDIFNAMAKDMGYKVAEDVRSLFDRRINLERVMDSWGNARTVRRILSESIDNHAVNYGKLGMAKNMRHVICKEDVSPDISTNFFG